MIIQRLAKPLALGAILLGGLVSVGGGATFVALKITTDSKFCNSCHIMEPYVASWKTSSHSFVACVDCHYEPGILETVEGKFKALSQLAKYATNTQGTKPWAEVSDYSCMRSGCHSQRLLEGKIQYGRINFDHRDHLMSEKRGMKLRCTSCHSQIVQGEHLAVTPTTCILCHFRESPKTAKISACDHCHGPPKGPKDLGNGLSFQHQDYLARGVDCTSCHGDVTRGTGDVPRQRCGQCHNKQEHLDRYDDLEFVHRHHVTEHSVSCMNCHTEMRHGLPPREDHFRGDCKNCHTATHGSSADLVRGTGGRGVPDDPGIMYLARVTCNGCHRPPFPDAPVPQGGGTFKADFLACVDCHGPGFDGMAHRWQAEVREKVKDVGERVTALKGRLDQGGAGDLATARKKYEDAAWNLNVVLLDRSDGVHNLPYARKLLERAVADVADGLKALNPAAPAPAPYVAGPRIVSKQNCTVLCHAGIEERKIERGLGLPFPHATHVGKAALDCSTCHADKPHGTITVKAADCAACHHPKATETDQCAKCHAEVNEFKLHAVEGVKAVPMQDLDCAVCHTAIATGHKRADMKAACVDCHGSDPADAKARKDSEALDAWIASFTKPLDDLEARLPALPSDLAAEIRRDLAALRRAGPWHNVSFAAAETKRLAERVAAAAPGR